MPIELINNDEHKRMLEKIGDLPLGEVQAGIYRARLEELFVQFNSQLEEPFETIKACREVTDLVNSRQPLVNRKKYVRVRIRNGESPEKKS